jgi:hypothetical protein
LEECLPPAPNKQGDPSASASASIAITASEALGQIHIEDRLTDVLDVAHRTGFTVSSIFARANAEAVGAAASLQLITTRVTRDVFSRNWQITAKGLRWLNERRETA